jgi:wyosine [tRNA(Phe)-imidazoG37] synthetase (radical SAM superfamily)
MLVHGLNDTSLALKRLAKALALVKPDTIHINLPTRPPAETWVHPPDEESLIRSMAILGNIAEMVRQEELERTLARWTPGQVDKALMDLSANQRVHVVERYGVRFWSAAPSHFPDEVQSLRTIPRRHMQSNKRR